MALINAHGPMYHDHSYMYGNIPKYQCKKLQIIIVKIVAVLMVMVMIVTYCMYSTILRGMIMAIGP